MGKERSNIAVKKVPHQKCGHGDRESFTFFNVKPLKMSHFCADMHIQRAPEAYRTHK